MPRYNKFKFMLNDDTYLTFEPYHPVNNPAAF